MNTVNQPTLNPTNKLTAAVVATAFMELLRVVMTHALPDYYDDGLWSAMLPIVVFAVGWFVKDHPNSIIVPDEEE